MRILNAALCGLVVAAHGFAAAEIQELKIPKGAGGIGFLPLLVMEQQKTIENTPRSSVTKGSR